MIQEQVRDANPYSSYRIDKTYVWGPGGLMFGDVDQSKLILAQAATRLYAQQDAAGNVVAPTSGGNVDRDDKVTPFPAVVEEVYHYNPYGRLTVLKPDYTPLPDSGWNWNLCWQAGWRDPLTGVYVGGDGAYHEQWWSLNPRQGMAQTEADFEANYQRAVAAADPSSKQLLHSPGLNWIQKTVTDSVGRSHGEPSFTRRSAYASHAALKATRLSTMKNMTQASSISKASASSALESCPGTRPPGNRPGTAAASAARCTTRAPAACRSETCAPRRRT